MEYYPLLTTYNTPYIGYFAAFLRCRPCLAASQTASLRLENQQKWGTIKRYNFFLIIARGNNGRVVFGFLAGLIENHKTVYLTEYTEIIQIFKIII